MKTRTKVWPAIIGILLIALGACCFCKHVFTLFSMAILIGIVTRVIPGMAHLVALCGVKQTDTQVDTVRLAMSFKA